MDATRYGVPMQKHEEPKPKSEPLTPAESAIVIAGICARYADDPRSAAVQSAIVLAGMAISANDTPEGRAEVVVHLIMMLKRLGGV
jgi:hypothetical protein